MEMKKYKLGEYLDSYGDGIHGTPQYDENGEYYFINGNNLKEGKIEITSNTLKISTNEYNKIKRNLYPDRTLLVSINGTLGNVALYENEKIALGKSACFLNLKNDVCRDFLRYIFETKEFKKYMNRIAGQSTIKNVSPTQISEYVFFAPETKNHKKIAAVLSALDDKIALNRRINAKLEQMAKRLYDYWFVQFDFPNADGKPYKSSGGKMVWNEVLKREIPYGWEVKSVKQIIKPIERGISYTTESIRNENGIPMINLACYDKKGEYRTNEFKYYSGNYLDTDKAFPLEMFVACTDMTQNADIIGRPIFAPKEYPWYVYSMDLAKIIPKSVSKIYLYYSLRTNFYHKYIKPFASGTNVKHLNIKGIERYPILIPQNSIQDEFEKVIIKFKEKQLDILNEIKKLTNLRNKLLPLLMNGQVEVG